MRVSLRRRMVRLRRFRVPIFLPVLGVALALFFGFWWAVNACLRPAVETLAVSDTVNRISLAISQSVTRCVSEQNMVYSDFVTMETDQAGNVTSLTSNLASTSRLNSLLVEEITQDLGQLQQEQFGIPLGTLTGWVIFSGKGPVIEVELLSAGDVTTQFRHSFEQAGINQTLHRVMLDVSVTVYLLIPGETLSTQVDSEVCVAETVIVGQVPETYLYLGSEKGNDG